MLTLILYYPNISIVTNNIKETLDTAEGVEILKINSRYRFFIGVGKMFDFKDVRTNIEEKLL